MGDRSPRKASESKQASYKIYGYSSQDDRSTNMTLASSTSSYSKLPQEIRDSIMKFTYKTEETGKILPRSTDLIIKKSRDPLLIERHGEDFFIDNGIVIPLPKWVGDVLVSKHFFADALSVFMQACVVQIEGCNVDSKKSYLACRSLIVCTGLLPICFGTLRRCALKWIDSSPSTSIDVLLHGGFFECVREMSILLATPAVWTRDTAELKLYPFGRVRNQEDLGLVYDVFDTAYTEVIDYGEQRTRVKQYLAGDPTYQYI